jgi:hypothetical protein
MSVSKFEIGQKVKTKDGDVGTVADILTSSRKATFAYVVKFDGHPEMDALYSENSLEEYIEPVTYDYEIECLENIVLVRLYELRGESKTEIARGHGHIIHEGALGVAQAASYALKRIFFDISNREDE